MTILALTDALTKLKIDIKWAEPLLETFQRYEINTPERQAAFIGQCQHESGNFKTLEENLNYSAEGLMKTWPSRFPTLEAAQPYHRQPEKIANKVYANRLGNGLEASGDGWKYRGRGLIQLTGKANYEAASKAISIDYVNNPQLVILPVGATLTAGWFWSTKGLNALATDYVGLTKRINGGIIGLDDRIAKINAAMSVLA